MNLILILTFVLILILFYCLTFYNNKNNESFMIMNDNLEDDDYNIDVENEDIIINPYEDISKSLLKFSFKELNLKKDEFLNKFMIYYINEEYLYLKNHIENLNIELNSSLDKKINKVYSELVFKVIKLININDINQEFNSLPNKYSEIIKEIFKKDNKNLSEDNIINILYMLINKLRLKVISILNLFNFIDNNEENKETFINIDEINNLDNYLNDFYNKQPFIFNK
jgi:hypothetical protein